ncbi:MAG: hypothetical protein HY319_21630 [Armatimonadetes bacterium]|nr:hypothetical protein [Armatimonadota bacterium]
MERSLSIYARDASRKNAAQAVGALLDHGIKSNQVTYVVAVDLRKEGLSFGEVRALLFKYWPEEISDRQSGLRSPPARSL